RSAMVEIHDDQETEVDLVLERAATTVHFVVRAPTIDAETIRVKIDDGEGRRVHSGSSWRSGRTDLFEHRIGLMPGAHRVSIVGPQAMTAVREFEVAAGVDELTVDLTLP
ncbi:MAG: hypothetical protein IT459_11830, partial [Planctomycetes bacterium]|nr:hypothetical protein [Planctomycetota bacterium]